MPLQLTFSVECGVHCSCNISVGQTASLPKLREVPLFCEVKQASICCMSQALHVRSLTEWRTGAKEERLTSGSLKACRPCSYDLTDAMSLPFDQAVCEVNQHRGSSHAVHKLDVLKGRLTVLRCIPVHATSATLRWCMRWRM